MLDQRWTRLLRFFPTEYVTSTHTATKSSTNNKQLVEVISAFLCMCVTPKHSSKVFFCSFGLGAVKKNPITSMFWQFPWYYAFHRFCNSAFLHHSNQNLFCILSFLTLWTATQQERSLDWQTYKFVLLFRQLTENESVMILIINCYSHGVKLPNICWFSL